MLELACAYPRERVASIHRVAEKGFLENRFPVLRYENVVRLLEFLGYRQEE
jgi:hypothetical protein